MQTHKITPQKLEDFNKYKDPDLYSEKIVFEELQELSVTSSNGEARMYLLVGRGTLPLNNDTKDLFAEHLKEGLEKESGSNVDFTVKGTRKEKISGKSYNVLDIDEKDKNLNLTVHLHYYIRNIKNNYVAIIIEGTNKKDIKKLTKAFKKYK